MTSQEIDEPPPLIDDDEEIEDEDIDEEEANFIEDPCLDLFSEQTFDSAQIYFDHCKTSYGFDINVI